MIMQLFTQGFYIVPKFDKFNGYSESKTNSLLVQVEQLVTARKYRLHLHIHIFILVVFDITNE